MAQKRKKAFTAAEKKKSILSVCCFGLPVLAGIVVMLCLLLPQERAVTSIGTIGGLEITREELLLYAEGERATVAQYYMDTYDAKADQGFWNRSFDGKTPSDAVKEKALHKLAAVKTEQKLMLEHGIIRDAGYEQFLQDFSAENRRRKAAAADGEILYGPEEYEERDYFLMLHEKRRNELIKVLTETVFSITEAEKQELYQTAQREKAAFLIENGACRSYESVEALLEKQAAELKYQEYLDQVQQTADIQLIDRQYDKIIMN